MRKIEKKQVSILQFFSERSGVGCGGGLLKQVVGQDVVRRGKGSGDDSHVSDWASIVLEFVH